MRGWALALGILCALPARAGTLWIAFPARADPCGFDQLASALRARLPGVEIRPGVHDVGPSDADVALDLRDDQWSLRVAAAGEQELRRELPPPGADCLALSETAALMVERYLDDLRWTGISAVVAAVPAPTPAPPVQAIVEIGGGAVLGALGLTPAAELDLGVRRGPWQLEATGEAARSGQLAFAASDPGPGDLSLSTALAQLSIGRLFGVGFGALRLEVTPGAELLWAQASGAKLFQQKPGFAAADVPRLKLKWAFGFPNETTANAQPTVIGGRVFIGSSRGNVYSLDAATGCIYWTYSAGAAVRNSVTVGKTGARHIVYFGDAKAFAHAVDADTGKLLWKVKVEDFPVAKITGSPAFYNGRLYVPIADLEEPSTMSPGYECCKYHGSISALDGETGKIIWQSFTVLDPPKPYKTSTSGTQLYGPAGASVWSSPTIDAKRKLVYASTGNSFTGIEINTSDSVLAFDLETGKLVWSSQVSKGDNWTMACGPSGKANCPEDKGTDTDFGTSPALRSIGGGKQVLVVGQKSGILWGLDPDNKGKVLWQTRIGNGGALGGIEWEMWDDDWTVVTKDRSITAQFEHTMVVTERGVEVLTLP